MSNLHWKVSPSGLYRLFDPRTGAPRCPGSVRLCAKVPKKTSVYAQEGTAAHFVASQCLEHNLDPENFIGNCVDCSDSRNPSWAGSPGKNDSVFTVTDEMAQAVLVYVNEVRSSNEALCQPVCYVEKSLDIGWLVPKLRGTGDHVAIEALGKVVVHDYKHGMGVAVDADYNPQMMAYALGALGRDNVACADIVQWTIVQPRAFHAAGAIRSQEMSADDLVAWGMDILRPGVLRVDNKDAEIQEGEWCRFCDAKGVNCPLKQTSTRTTLMQALPEECAARTIQPTSPDLLSSDELAEVLHAKRDVENWLKACWDEAMRRAEEGNPPSGYKLVAGRKSRNWKDERSALQLAAQCLHIDQYAPRTPVTPAQLEKLLKEVGRADIVKLLDVCIDVKQGATLAPVTDPRRDLSETRIEAMFGKSEKG